MKLIRAISVAAAVSLSLLLGAPALADPPPASNPNTVVWTFHCSRGAETSSFQAISIQQNAAIALQLLDGTGVVVFTHVSTVNVLAAETVAAPALTRPVEPLNCTALSPSPASAPVCPRVIPPGEYEP